MSRNALRLVTLCLLALSLAGCDKCSDYFWLDTSTPHSCKDAPATK